MSRFRFSETGWEHYIYWEDENLKISLKIRELLKDIARHPFTGLGKPEPLKGSRAGQWSRRIDKAHRLIYYVNGDTIEIVSCKGHYED